MPVEFSGNTKKTSRKNRCRDQKGVIKTKRLERQIKGELDLMERIITHDLINQLTALHALLSLTELAANSQDVKQYIRKEERIAQVMQTQIQFMRDLQNEGKFSPAWHDIDTDIRRIFDAMHLSSEISVDVQGRGFEIYTDPLLACVFYGFAVNSLMHGKTMTAITLRAEESEGSLVIIYRDNGCGIPKEEKEKIFLKGYGKNTGLGLSLIREILAANQMSVFENGVPGKGAQFVIRVSPGLYRKKTGDGNGA